MNNEDLTPENLYDYIEELNIYGYVYMIANNINGKNYVGQRKIICDKNDWSLYYGSGQTIKNAILKYGKENFTKTLIDIAESPMDLSIKEDYYINEEQIGGRGQYNKTKGIWKGYDNQPKDPEKARMANEKRKKTRQENDYKKYLSIIDGKEDLIIETYKRLQHIEKTVKELNLPKSVIIKFLHENNVILNSQNVKGRKLSKEQKKKIANGLKKSKIINIYFKYCLYSDCNNYFSSSRKKTKFCSNECSLLWKRTDRVPGNKINLPEDPEIIRKLYWDEELSATKIALQYNCNEQTIRNYMKKHNIPVRSFKESSKISHNSKNQKGLELSCLNCKNTLSIIGFTNHYNYCITRKRCMFKNCNDFIAKTNKSGYCKDHYAAHPYGFKKFCSFDGCDKILKNKSAKNCREHMTYNYSYKECDLCERVINTNNFKNHYKSCSTLPICSNSNCIRPIKESRSTKCWKC